MIYKEALNYVSNISRFGSHYTLDRVRRLCAYLGNPQDDLKFVHVAGTDGKGSVTAYLTSVLVAAGYAVGTFNSPYVFNYNERFLLNGKNASNEIVAKHLTTVKDAVEAVQRDDADFYLTAFEIETVAAFLMFKDERCDVVVLEVGLGGRLDATNVITNKEIAVLTSIGFDHCQLLGNTLAAIAAEKAAIILDNAVTCNQCDEVLDVFRARAKNLMVCGDAALVSRSLDGQTFVYDGKEYTISLLGAYQLQNAPIAIEAVKALREKGWNISEQALKDGLKQAKWRVRFEVKKTANDKYLVLDGAHNPHGAKALGQSMQAYFAGVSAHFIMGILADKDEDGILDELLPLADKITFVTPPSPRAEQAENLKTKALAKGYGSSVAPSVRSALETAFDGACEVIVLCGSLTLFETEMNFIEYI